MDSIFTDAIAPTPDVRGGHDGTRGGFDIKDGQKETSGLVFGQTPTLTNVKDGGAGIQTGLDVIKRWTPGSDISTGR